MAESSTPARSQIVSAPREEPKDESVAALERDGFVHLRAALNRGTLKQLHREVTEVTVRHVGLGPPFAEPHVPLSDTLQVRNTWQLSDPIRSLVCSRSLAATAGELINAGAMQLYADLAIVKEPTAPAGPWHVDGAHSVVAPDSLLIAYIPLTHADGRTGGLALRSGSHLTGVAKEFKPTSRANVRRSLKKLTEAGCTEVMPSYDVGDVLFYTGATFHRLSANHGATPAVSLWVMFIPHGQTMVRIRNAFQAIERQRFFSDVLVGRPLTTALTPLLWQR
jgi:Phytanoyl-CoA dioxygenase (PhyH)